MFRIVAAASALSLSTLACAEPPPVAATGPVLLIAAGIGVTPYLAQLAAGAARNRDVVLLYLAKSTAELAYADALEQSGARVIARLSDGSAPPSFMEDAGKVSRPPEPLDGAALKELVPDIASREVFVSGSPASVRSLRSAARSAGARRIRTDSFAGY